jgi:hypothetical protein
VRFSIALYSGFPFVNYKTAFNPSIWAFFQSNPDEIALSYAVWYSLWTSGNLYIPLESWILNNVIGLLRVKIGISIASPLVSVPMIATKFLGFYWALVYGSSSVDSFSNLEYSCFL